MKTLIVGVMFTTLLLASSTQAAEVSVKGVHLCCGMCVKAVGTALGKVDGVTDAACDREAQTVSFKASDEKATTAGLRALARAGFFGKATVDGKAGKFPGGPPKKDRKADTVAVKGVHICCGGCIKAIAAAVKGLDGVENASCDIKTRTVTLTGKDISVAAAISALNKIGYGGRVPKKKE